MRFIGFSFALLLASCLVAAGASAQQIVFVTEAQVQGDIQGGSLPAADEICRSEAESAGLTGRFVAWLSTDVESAAERIGGSTGPFELPSGALIAADLTDLLDDTIANGISETATGGVGSGSAVWTGTARDGAARAQNCGNWTDLDFPVGGITGASGQTSIGGWTDNGANPCRIQARLYCFELPPPAVPSS